MDHTPTGTSSIELPNLCCVLAAKILTVYFVVCTLAVKKKNQGRFRHVGSDHSLVRQNVIGDTTEQLRFSKAFSVVVDSVYEYYVRHCILSQAYLIYVIFKLLNPFQPSDLRGPTDICQLDTLE
jgi:hypothetical protein